MDQDGEILKRRHLSSLLSIKKRFHLQWNLIETVEPIHVSSFKSVSPSLKPLIGREINTYIEKFHSFRSPRSCFAVAAGQTLYGLTPTALRRWSHSNLALRRMANLSTRWSNIGQDCRESEGVLGLQIALQLER